MTTKLQVAMKLDQRLMMSQQLRQAITLLQYNTLDIKQIVQQALEKNPLLELEEEEFTPIDHYSADVSRSTQSYYQYESDNMLENVSNPKSLREYLLDQTLLCRFNPVEQCIAQAIIDSLDEKGYLTVLLEDIQQMLHDVVQTDMQTMRLVLAKMQTFTPTGVCASDARECLLLQLNALENKDKIWKIACKIVGYTFEQVASNNTKKLIKQLGITQQEYSEAIALMRTLNPNPGADYSNHNNINIEPELYVAKHKNIWQVHFSESILTNVKINKQYQDLIKQNKKHDSYGVLKKELEEARFLLTGLKRRNQTLLAVAEYIVEMQQDFLDHGAVYMKSMNIADAALALNVHESTISRITTGKYISTPRGVFELKYFFSSHVSNQAGDFCSAVSVKALIQKIISQETFEHIFSDAELTEKLREENINIARRTVAKYREAMNILPSYQRKPTSKLPKVEV